MDQIDGIKSKCWDNSLQTFGYSYIFMRRAMFYRKWLRILSLLGILVPLIIGTAATGYGIDSDLLKALIWVSVPLSLIQITISAFALINIWEDMVSYSLEAVAHYNMLSDQYKEMATNDIKSPEQFIADYNNLNIHYNFRSQSDVKYLVTDLEKRIGMRWALREFQRACVGCQIIPISMDSTECPVCGNFKKSQILKIINHG
jgi:mobilome CxxCx(11)CxxC protein